MINETPLMARASSWKDAVKRMLTTLFLTLLFVGYLSQRVTGTATVPQVKVKESKNPLTSTEKNVALGLNHFDAHCATCHGAGGQGDTKLGKSLGAPDLTSEKTQSKSDAEFFRVISQGVKDKGMPAFGKSHQPMEIWQTILFLRKLPSLTPEERKMLESAVPPGARHKHGDHEHEAPQVEPQQEPAKPEHEHGGTGQAGEKREQPKQQTSSLEHAGHQMDRAQADKKDPASPELKLADLERMAAQNNPTLAQAEAAIRAAEGRKKQAGLYPNPIVGYRGEEFAFRAFNEKSEHFFFLEQTIVTAGKLGKSRRIFAQEQAQAEADAEAQRMRVLNTVRLLYYEVQGTQQLVELRTELAKIAREAAGISGELFNIGQADRPDLLEAEIEAQRAELDLVTAENDRDQVWQLLAAVVGVPSLRLTRVEGDLERELPLLDQAAMLATLLRTSPEIKRAQAGVERAQAALERAKVEPIPDLFVRGAIGYSTEVLERLNRGIVGRTGAEASVEVGVRLPLFNRNQGNITAARAELLQAERETQRQELALRARLASAFQAYLNALRVVQRYRESVLPRAQKAYELYVGKFREMAAAYPQVLIAQRTVFQARADYVNSLVALWQNATQIQGLLLTGGLDAPGGALRELAIEPGQAPGIKYGIQGTGIREGSELREQ